VLRDLRVQKFSSRFMTVQDIPALNAALNGLSTLFLTAGFFFIMRKNIPAHRACMLTAGAISAIFLVGYVTHKILVRGVHTPFGGEGTIRTVYYAMLLTHIVLAIAIAFLVPKTFSFALKGQFDRHRAWARWTFPIWYYVSVTGVLVYFFLYRWWPATTT
jgi:putative membrane protein